MLVDVIPESKETSKFSNELAGYLLIYSGIASRRHAPDGIAGMMKKQLEITTRSYKSLKKGTLILR